MFLKALDRWQAGHHILVEINAMLYVADAMCSQLKQPGEDIPCFLYIHIYINIYTYYSADLDI